MPVCVDPEQHHATGGATGGQNWRRAPTRSSGRYGKRRRILLRQERLSRGHVHDRRITGFENYRRWLHRIERCGNSLWTQIRRHNLVAAATADHAVAIGENQFALANAHEVMGPVDMASDAIRDVAFGIGDEAKRKHRGGTNVAVVLGEYGIMRDGFAEFERIANAARDEGVRIDRAARTSVGRRNYRLQTSTDFFEPQNPEPNPDADSGNKNCREHQDTTPLHSVSSARVLGDKPLAKKSRRHCNRRTGAHTCFK